LSTYTDVPENHKKDCPVREVMEVRLAQEEREGCRQIIQERARGTWKLISPSWAEGEAVTIHLLDKCILDMSPGITLSPEVVNFIISEIQAVSVQGGANK